MQQQELIPHLFRTEFSKITAVLCKLSGIEHLKTAEDIASETFLAALETWSYKGLPENPVAWLYTVAKNKAKNHIARGGLFAGKVAPTIIRGTTTEEEFDIDLSPKNIADSQLQMLFAVCHPSIPAEAQIGLALRILCGFGIEEIANALLTNKETVNKRLYRAKEKLRTENITLELPGEKEITTRLGNVLTTLYLLFSEGYYSESEDAILREDLCLEALRLACMLTENEQTNIPEVNALIALMCFHASRFVARRNDSGTMVLYQDQDDTLWNQELIAKGAYYLHLASHGDQLSRYHLEACIAYWHTMKTDTPEKWQNILQLFNQLLHIAHTPIAALNRIYAVSKVKGKEQAIAEASQLNAGSNPYYFALLGELYTGIDNTAAKEHFTTALQIARTTADRQIIKGKIKSL